MRTTGLVVVGVVMIGGFGCFSTARYDDAHMQRVASINARYEAETVQAERREVDLASVIEQHRALLIPVRPDSSTPVSRIDEREDIVECRRQCERRGIDESSDGHPNDQPQIEAQCLHDICEPAYVDALTKTYFDADVHWATSQLAASEGADLESLLAFSHNQAVSRHIEEETHDLAQLQEQKRQRLERDRQVEIAASARLRDSEVESGRAAHRARVQAAAFAARDPGPVAARPSSLCLGVQRVSLVAGCRSVLPLPDHAPGPDSASAPNGP